MADDLENDDQGQGGQPPAQLPPPKEEPPAQLPPAEKDANVILAHDARPVTENGPVNVGLDITINLPSAAQQRAGFRLEPRNARLLLQLYPTLYKRFVRKDGTARTDGADAQNGGAA